MHCKRTYCVLSCRAYVFLYCIELHNVYDYNDVRMIVAAYVYIYYKYICNHHGGDKITE